MFSSIQDFLADFRDERDGTLKLFGALSDASLAQSVAANHRTLGRMAWHIVTTYPEMLALVDLKIDGVDEKSSVPTRAPDIVAAYQKVSDQLLEQVGGWNDSFLMEERNCYGSMWKIGFTLEVLIRHEAHHRGQMTVLMRQAGLKVPGVYGPAYEGWSTFGEQPPEV